MNDLQSSQLNSKRSRRNFLKATAVAGGAAILGGMSLSRNVHAAGSDVLKVGLVGCGGRGGGAAVNAINADKGVRVVALADAFADRLETARQLLQRDYPEQAKIDDAHCFVGFDGYKELIASGVDVVLLATPPHFRPMQLKACIDAGKHVFVEKPVGVDATGIRSVAATCEEAKKKGISVFSGLCWRFNPCAQESIQRIHDGAIGDIVAMYATDALGSLWQRPRKPDWSEMTFQMRNWYYFTWLSGDFCVEQHVHAIDKCSWAMKDRPPVKAWATGGRQVRTQSKFGQIYDHFTLMFDYDNGVKLYVVDRQQPGCYNEYCETIVGTKGVCELHKGVITGENKWRFNPKDKRSVPSFMGGKNFSTTPGEFNNMHQIEQNVFFASIRDGKPVNHGGYMCQSTMIGVLGRTAAYTGQQVTWEQIMQSKEDLMPKQYSFNAEPPVLPDADGKYPVAMPGVTRMV